jgi:hypothetical protein
MYLSCRHHFVVLHLTYEKFFQFFSRLVTVLNSRTLDSATLVLPLPKKYVGCKLKEMKKHKIGMASKSTSIPNFVMLVSLLKNW